VREGLLDPIPVERIDSFLAALTRRLDDTESKLLDEVEKPGPLSPETEARLRTVITSERNTLLPAGGGTP
jgi:hypothetical protein